MGVLGGGDGCASSGRPSRHMRCADASRGGRAGGLGPALCSFGCRFGCSFGCSFGSPFAAFAPTCDVTCEQRRFLVAAAGGAALLEQQLWLEVSHGFK